MAVEKKSIKPARKRKAGKAVRHEFSPEDVLLAKILAQFPFPLSMRDKESLARIIAHGSKSAANWSRQGADIILQSGEMTIILELKSFRQTVDENLEAYRWGKRRVVSSSEILSGEPVFRGTRIPVAHVISLFRKAIPEQEIAEDYPALDPRDLAYARLAARVGEGPGRPRKRLKIQRVRGTSK